MRLILRAWMLSCALAALTGPAAQAAAAPPDGVSSAPPQIVLMEGEGRQLAFLTEKSSQRFHVYEWKDGRARLVETLPCTTGKATGDKRVEGDLKTPEGAYRFLRYIDGSQLPPLYGAGAFVMDYPNPFDRRDRKTGSGIWMHGVETNDRVHVARDTRGCVALANPDVERLRPLIRLHDTPIIVVERLEGVPPERVAADAAAMKAFVEGWRAAWESKDMDAYERRYAPDFAADGRDVRSWMRQKRELARSESVRRIGADDLTILRERDRWWVSFRQEYSTPGHSDVGRKTLFIRGTGPSDWAIVGEQWRPLRGGFRLVEPVEPAAPRMSPALLAAIAPDAAPASAIAQAPRPAPESAPPPAAAVAEASPAPEASQEAPDAVEIAEPAAPAPPEAPMAAPSRSARLGARLEAARSTRRTYQLFAPHVQRQGESLLVQVQLLNLRATTARAGALVLTLPGGQAAEPPQVEPFTVKQGRLISLALPDAELPLRVGIQVRDEAGNVALDQDLVIEELPAGAGGMSSSAPPAPQQEPLP